MSQLNIKKKIRESKIFNRESIINLPTSYILEMGAKSDNKKLRDNVAEVLKGAQSYT